jgi:UDP-glucuronate 4-epimerase
MKTIIVSGGCGFIGSHLIDRLLAEGNRVICFDSFDNLYDPALKFKNVEPHINNPNFRLISGSVTESESMEKAFSVWGIDAVVHLAALAGVRPSVQSPGLHFRVNVLGTVNMLELCRKNGVEKIVIASSSSVYGNNASIPFKESDASDRPLCPYAASKKACEEIGFTYHWLHKMDVACIRPFTVYGPRQRIDMAIPLFVRSIYEGKEITLHSPEKVSRDFTYVDDVVSGIMAILGRNHGFEVYNIGSGQSVNLNELLAHIERATGLKAKVKIGELGNGEADRTLADISKARKYLGYDPQFTVERGLVEYVKWFNDQDLR